MGKECRKRQLAWQCGVSKRIAFPKAMVSQEGRQAPCELDRSQVVREEIISSI